VGSRFNPLSQMLFWYIRSSWLILTWIGSCAVEEPYVLIGQLSTTAYFSYFILNPLVTILWDSTIRPLN
jgi:hypothetical protein